MNKLRYVFDAVTSIRKALNGRVPLIGFSGSPWTLACYMVEGAGSDDYRLVKSLMYSRPDLMHRILEINALSVAEYLNAQIDAGAQAVMIFDSWGGVMADGAFQQFSLKYTELVLSKLKKHHEGQQIPRIVFTKGGGLWLPEMADLDCEVLGVDWTVNLAKARAQVGGKLAQVGSRLIDSVAKKMTDDFFKAFRLQLVPAEAATDSAKATTAAPVAASAAAAGASTGTSAHASNTAPAHAAPAQPQSHSAHPHDTTLVPGWWLAPAALLGAFIAIAAGRWMH
jgi:hypothetical protein